LEFPQTKHVTVDWRTVIKRWNNPRRFLVQFAKW